MRTRITLLICKCIRFILVKMGRGGSLPGQIALSLYPSILKNITYPKVVVMVTGTNGKTSTCNMIYEVLSKKYDTVIGNRRGDNLLEGVTTLILGNTGFDLKVNADAVIMEVDELNVPKVLSNVKVSHFIVNNFFRDQIDRAGEMEKTILRVQDGVNIYDGVLILNGNDPNVARLGYHRENTYYFGVEKNALSSEINNEVADGKYCFHCREKLAYDFYQYSHIGQFHCTTCDFGNFEFSVLAKNVNVDAKEFSVDGKVFHAPQEALFTIYNCMGIILLAKLLSIDFTIVDNVLSSFSLKEGRMETFFIGKECLLNLIKNPAGANETMKYIQKDKEDKDILIVLNNHIPDGVDITWLWDANFELLMSEDVKNVICSGFSPYEIALRFKYAGFKGNIIVEEDLEKAVKKFKELENHAYVLATYTAVQPTRAVLRREEE